MRVGVEGCGRFGVPQCPLNGDNVAPRSDQPRCVEVAKVAQGHALDARFPLGLPEPVADCVLMRRVSVGSHEQPVVLGRFGPVDADVLGDDGQQGVWDWDGTRRPVLWGVTTM